MSTAKRKRADVESSAASIGSVKEAQARAPVKARYQPNERWIDSFGELYGSKPHDDAVRIRLVDADDPTPEQAIAVVLQSLTDNQAWHPLAMKSAEDALTKLGMTYRYIGNRIEIRRI